MQISNTHDIACSADVAWRELNRVEVLARCIPGCETVDRTGDSSYTATVVIKIGPIKARFVGEVEISEIEPLKCYVISGAGKGGVAGFAKGSAKVTLTELEPRLTRLDYIVDANIGGKIAQIGSRMITNVVERMAEEFFGCFGAHLDEMAAKISVEPSSNSSPL